MGFLSIHPSVRSGNYTSQTAVTGVLQFKYAKNCFGREAGVGLVVERDFLVQDYDQPWVRCRKYRIWGGVFLFWKKKGETWRVYRAISLMVL
jgi:hypothetical protein